MAMVCQSGDGASMGRAHMQARTSSGRTFKNFLSSLVFWYLIVPP